MIFIIAAVLALVIASYTDIKTREVPDWLNYSLIIFGLGGRLMYSLASFDWSYIIQGIAGFIAFLVVALIMFYMGQWGGGDSKMLMGLGATIGLKLTYDSFLLGFIINILLAGAVYGLIYSLVLAILNKKKFLKRVKVLMTEKSISLVRKIILILMLILVGIIILVHDPILKLLFGTLLLMVPLTFYIWIFVKSIENIVMLKYVTPDKLTEGDWIPNKITIDGNYICGPKDLGIDKKQIQKLIAFYKRGKIKKILVKYGIPFVPSFLIGFILSLLGFNPILLFL